MSEKMKQSRAISSVSARVTQSPALYWSLQNLLIPFELHRRTSSSSLNWGPLALQPTPSRNKRKSHVYCALTLMSLLSYSNIHFIISKVCWPQSVSANHPMPAKFLQRSRGLSRVLHPTRQTPPQRRGLFQDQLGIHST